MKNNKYIQEIETKGIKWINVSKQSEPELNYLQKQFDLDELDIKESLPPFQRAKIAKRPDYYFMVLHFPIFDRVSRRLLFTEVDFFLSHNYLITVHDGKLIALEQFFNQCKKYPQMSNEYFTGSAVHILFELLNRMLEAIFPILLHVNDDITLVDKKLFTHISGQEMAEEVLRLKTNVVTFRRTMQGHRTVMERLILYSGMFNDKNLDLQAQQHYINSLREFTSEIWHMLENQRESINALHETNESIISLRTNQVMKILTIISVITFPLSLLAAIFAIDAPGRPFVDWPYGFWIICGLMVLGATFMISLFKKKKWL
ncbi:MAG: hypothetical protein COU29_03685 [Candidatus Magasanikbacteria bacterium CG10_big_fil_rev_8_21_14_0_10_36_32]|uniref:Magnesium transporter CorA n=1 Tax=Candidatus Magasanikbacteria bacterium CG10_big_fil_rev_8_21_14_0_10_36_32 TaxID=1974646 RepID=A0A2M6W5L3_9BACT|nr:MAG: hypothetical protein COU29_03685 [Candidatus Magasanikbacteria bacterium CG10_big_fil_rev_8_21_14_0_10_36_32]